MNKVKNFIKLILGVYNIFVIKENIHKFLNTKFYKENCELEKKRIDFYSKFINDEDLVYDVGANFGNRVKTFLNLNAKVLAVEPQEECCKYLRKKYGDKIILIDKAVGSVNDKKKMYISKNSAISSFSEDWIKSVKKERYKDEEWKETEIKEQVTLDSIIDKYGTPMFIKIDVEGYELEVIKGLSKPIKMISFEYTIPEQIDKAVDCIFHIKKINGAIECNYSLGESMNFELSDWISDEEMIKLIKSEDFSAAVGDIYLRRK